MLSDMTTAEPSIAAAGSGPTDAALAAAWRGGDEEAFAALVARYGGLVRAACARQAPRNDVEDCVQAVFLVLSRRPDAAAACPSLAAWLLRVSSFVCRRAQRSAQRRQRAEARASLLAQPAPPPAETPSDEAIRLLDDCLLRLPERQRLAVVMRYLSGRSPEDIASVLGVTRNNAYQLLNRGMDRLRDLFERRGVAIGGAAIVALLAAASDAATAEAGTAQPSAPLLESPSAQAKTLASGSWWWTRAKHGGLLISAAALLVVGLAAVGLGHFSPGRPAGPSAAATAIPEDDGDPGWRSPIPRQGLDGWDVHRGTWRNADGILSAATDEGNGARIRSIEAFGDLDLRCRVRVTGTAEIQLCDYSAFFSVLSTGGRWVEIRLTRRGDRAACLADGIRLPLESESLDPLPRSGPLAFHGHYGAIEIADLRVRPLSADTYVDVDASAPW